MSLAGRPGQTQFCLHPRYGPGASTYRPMLTTEKQILALGTELHARRGELLYRKQQPAEYVFYLLNGAVGIRGDDSHTRHLAGCRCFLGLRETCLLYTSPSPRD